MSAIVQQVIKENKQQEKAKQEQMRVGPYQVLPLSLLLPTLPSYPLSPPPASHTLSSHHCLHASTLNHAHHPLKLTTRCCKLKQRIRPRCCSRCTPHNVPISVPTSLAVTLLSHSLCCVDSLS